MIFMGKAAEFWVGNVASHIGKLAIGMSLLVFLFSTQGKWQYNNITGYSECLRRFEILLSMGGLSHCFRKVVDI